MNKKRRCRQALPGVGCYDEALSPVTHAVLKISTHVVARTVISVISVVYAVTVVLLVALIVVSCHVTLVAQSVEVVLERQQEIVFQHKLFGVTDT